MIIEDGRNGRISVMQAHVENRINADVDRIMENHIFDDGLNKHVFGAMDRDSALKIANHILENHFNLAHFILSKSTGWSYDRSNDFMKRYKIYADWAGKSEASKMFLKENFVIELDDFITSEEMVI